MHKRVVTYKNFDDEEVTETLYFNMEPAELVEFQSKYPGGFQGFIQRVVEAQDLETLVSEFKNLVLLTYGVKSEDGRRFIKNDQLREEFAQTRAYSMLFMELSTDADKAAEFVTGVVPAQTPQQQDKPTSLPAPKAIA